MGNDGPSGDCGPAVDASLALLWLCICEMIAGERSERFAKEFRGEEFENGADCTVGDGEGGDVDFSWGNARSEVCGVLGEAPFALNCVEETVVGSKEAGIGGGGISSSSDNRMSPQQMR